MSEERRPTIDERIEALMVKMRERREEMRLYDEKQRRLDEIERRGRRAILVAIGAYLEELRAAENGDAP
jgi:hypothetical protein